MVGLAGCDPRRRVRPLARALFSRNSRVRARRNERLSRQRRAAKVEGTCASAFPESARPDLAARRSLLAVRPEQNHGARPLSLANSYRGWLLLFRRGPSVVPSAHALCWTLRKVPLAAARHDCFRSRAGAERTNTMATTQRLGPALHAVGASARHPTPRTRPNKGRAGRLCPLRRPLQATACSARSAVRGLRPPS